MDSTNHQHPSYGLVSFSRCSGNPKLFGSSLDTHYNYIKLSIKHGVLCRSDSGDSFTGPSDGDILEVLLSLSQYAELLTTMNCGLGTPCTISRINRQKIEPPPDDLMSETDNIKAEFRKRIQGMVASLAKHQADFKETMSKKALTKADRDAASKILDRAIQEIADNSPHFLAMFEEAAGKVVATAKAEVATFMALTTKERPPTLEDIENVTPALPASTETGV